MSYLKERERLLNYAVGVRSGVPYDAEMTLDGDPVKGHVIFSSKGAFTFDFYYTASSSIMLLEYQSVLLDSPQTLKLIDGKSFKVNIGGVYPSTMIVGMPYSSHMGGSIKDFYLGAEEEGLTSLSVYFGEIPTGWNVASSSAYYYTHSDTPPDGTRLGFTRLDAVDLRYNEWRVKLRAMIEHSVIDGIRHIARITREQPFSGEEAQVFLEDSLHPFLSFLFEHTPEAMQGIGYRGNNIVWGFSSSKICSKDSKTLKNWFSETDHSSDPSSLFAVFCGLDDEEKRILSNAMHYYAGSQEILSIASLPAATFSYSAFEGLVRWIGYTNDDIRGEFFRSGGSGRERLRQDQERRLKEDVSFIRLVMHVLESMSLIDSGPDSEVKDIVKSLRDVRDIIAHLTNPHDLSAKELYYTWNRTQFLVEALILRKLGFTGDIPNRTRMWKVDVGGEDLTREQRQEGELWIGSSDERETGATE
ncbi:MAG: hypothetical protein OXU67_13730 [Chloroflexota bacterium]|nr:hypothetical protein [Chloroflexota bacterium]